MDETPTALLRRCPVHTPTPLLTLPSLAAAIGVGSILAKDEGRRPLGSFKALGGVYAGLRAISRATKLPVEQLLDASPRRTLPALVCASDGNHGLAVAAAARLAGTAARVYLPASVPEDRAARIATKGAVVIRVEGTYDDAVRAAAVVAGRGEAILVADTSADPADAVVADVMAAYAVVAAEVEDALATGHHAPPTHIFVQAGVGGLAAAMADRLGSLLVPPARIVVVEPENAACVAAALRAGAPVAVPGDLETSAVMLSAGEVSAPALDILRRVGAVAVTVTEEELSAGPALLKDHAGPETTPSGAAGLAGLLRALREGVFGLGPDSRVLLFVTEAPPPLAGKNTEESR